MIRRAAAIAKHNLVVRRACTAMAHLAYCGFDIPSVRPLLLVGLTRGLRDDWDVLRGLVDGASRFCHTGKGCGV